ncbi:NADP oxidoreductase coenzyme F420-dependent [Planctomycetes bacterium Poly30]|uniref:NADP oxidoreductase coenzyme F420-dependent n=1 Tax=Saltatorellus ferox TaxID=2528018 RepID=A0A518EWY4_9BACT|nr:NADP oxidoreductase coenzyme F420-dependent [Planctomycetes bacterium Poly30]
MTRTIGIVGAGAVARALAAALTRRGAPEFHLLVWARRLEAAAAVAQLAQSGQLVQGRASAAASIGELRHCDVILVAVSDAAIEAVGELLLSEFTTQEPGSLSFPQAILHTGGARTGEDALAALASLDTALGSLHPLVAVSGDAAPAPELFAGMPFAVEATTAEATALARDLVGAMGGFEVELPAAPSRSAAREQKTRYHALATMVATGVVTLVDQAAAAMASADPVERERFRRAYGELARSAARNVLRDRGASVLTGAIARGDDALVDRHLAALAGTPNEPLYRAVESAARRMLNEPTAETPDPS